MRRALALLILLLAPVASAHGGGSVGIADTLASATPVGLPAYIFDETPPGTSVHYFRIDEAQAVDIRLRLVAPVGREPAQLPVVFVFGAGSPANVSTPPDVERPGSNGSAFPASERASTTIPAMGAQWSVLLERQLAFPPGVHVIALRTQTSGPLALILEEVGGLGVLERFIVPALRDDARAWEGVSAWPALVAGTLGVTAIGAYAWRARAYTKSFLAVTGYVAAAFFAASGFALATDSVHSGAGALLALASVGCALGIAAIARASAPGPRWTHRLGMVILAGVGFWLYAGSVWGPLTALTGALLPEPGKR
jgi:hypothetical protein